MAIYLQSPGIQVIEKDASAVTPGTSTTVGGTVGRFRWGPVMQPMLIDNESTLVSVFGKPDNNTFAPFYAAANFLAYANAIWVIREDAQGLNATSSGAGLQINNIDEYDMAFADGQSVNEVFAARYPGDLGNSISVSIADSASFEDWLYKSQFPSAPGTSEYVESKKGINDEMHIIVIDTQGRITGVPGATLEKFAFVSKASDAVSYQGLSNYYSNVLRNQSQYIYSLDNPSLNSMGVNWGESAVDADFQLLEMTSVGYEYMYTYNLTGGLDITGDSGPSMQASQLAWDLFQNVETYDISLFITGNANATLSKYVVDNIAEIRKDAVVFASLTSADGGPVFGTTSTRISEASGFKTTIGNSTYTVLDSGYKYMYDKYNDKYRWVALNADIAGLCAKVDANQDTWFSPAGMTKGQIRGSIKLSWNPNQAERDELYKLAINPVVSFTGQGTLLYGDKTATLKPSAFDRINVRRLFLVLEKSIARSAKYQLFELNDAITRLQFVSSVEPFLRDVQGRRGIDQFKVICDESNNTAQVISTNEFRGTILIKPVYSINFITLTFTAVGPNVSFETAAGV